MDVCITISQSFESQTSKMSKRGFPSISAGPPDPIAYLRRRSSTSLMAYPTDETAESSINVHASQSAPIAKTPSSLSPSAAYSILTTSYHESETNTDESHEKTEYSSSSGDVTPLEFRPRNSSSGGQKDDAKIDPPARERPLVRI